VTQLVLVRHTGKTQDVLGLLGLDDVDDVVEGDTTQELPGVGHHGNGCKIVPGDEAAHLLLVHIRQHGRHDRVHQALDGFGGLGRDQRIETDGSQEASVAIHHEHGVELLHLATQYPDLLQGLLGRE
jgi:hypothetical protein